MLISRQLSQQTLRVGFEEASAIARNREYFYSCIFLQLVMIVDVCVAKVRGFCFQPVFRILRLGTASLQQSLRAEFLVELSFAREYIFCNFVSVADEYCRCSVF